MQENGKKWSRSRWRRRWLAVPAVVLLAAAAWLLAPFWTLAGQLARKAPPQPSRLYGQPLELARGQSLDPETLAKNLEGLGYRATSRDRFGPGFFRRVDDALGVHLRAHPTPQGLRPPTPVEVRFQGGRIRGLLVAGEPVRNTELEPPLLTSFFSPQQEDRRPVDLARLPPAVIQAVLAAEDDGFYGHSGLSVSGILRAAWVNLRGGAVRQGGSTLTQQLVKNLFLTHERTLSRKIREAVLALAVELRYDKEAILEAYLNEIYLGRRGGANLMGIGAASYAFFGKSPAELDLAEAATLAGMIRAPALYDPIAHPKRARERRDQILDRLGELSWVSTSDLTHARESELVTAPRPEALRPTSYFADFIANEAARRFAITDLQTGGYQLLSTLDPAAQAAAEEAVAWGLEALEKGWQKGKAKAGEPLQAALVSVDPASGGIRAYLGGRGYAESQFDRASQGLRQAGSAFKPVVYAAAFEAGIASPSTLLDDSPLTVTMAGREWSPRNDDKLFEGWIPARSALERSRNVPTVRLALQVGMGRIVTMARQMGISTPLKPLPSLALGSFEVTPLEMAGVFATLAGGGVARPLHGLRGVVGADGNALAGAALEPPRKVLSAASAYLLTSVLQGVFDRGTARRARQDGLMDPLAGKTGTTNGRRDSWFAGYSDDRVAIVWVGYDQNLETRLSGSRAALPIWSRFMLKVRPPGGYGSMEPPADVVTAVIDPLSGLLATSACPQPVQEVFVAGREPAVFCHLHGGWPPELAEPPADRSRHPFRNWLDRVFRNRRQKRNPP
jgi:penicillin-binding protein 1B